jgi:hypothetical protein
MIGIPALVQHNGEMTVSAPQLTGYDALFPA